MKQAPPNEARLLSGAEIEARMRPGVFSRSGFLGPKERLGEVIAADSAALQNLNLTCAELASKLDALIAAAEISPTHQASMGMLQCRIQVHQGFQLCPWTPDPRQGQCSVGLGVRHASVDWWIANARIGEEMKGPGLVVHLIRDHHFFEGPTSPNRVEPSKLARVLNLR